MTMENAGRFQSNLEAMTEIYRGPELSTLEKIDHLVIVTGHAILLDKFNYMKDEAWVLESFQKGGQVQTFVDHVLKGIEIAQNDERSLLVFSGYIVAEDWLMKGVRHGRWLGHGVKGNHIGILRIIYIVMIGRWTSFYLRELSLRNLRGIRMRMFCFRCVDFSR